MSKDNRGRSAHANGGAAGVKKRFSLAARHRFFGQAPKKWGRMAGQANDHHPTYRRTRTKRKKREGGTPGEGSPLDPLLRFMKHKRVPRSAERGQGRCPCTPPPLKRRAKLSDARVARRRGGVLLDGAVEAGGTQHLPWRHPKARFFGAPPRFFAQEQRNGVEWAVGATNYRPRKRRTRTIPRQAPAPCKSRARNVPSTDR